MSIKEQHIEAIEKIAAKNINDRENVKIDHESMVLHKKELTRDIISLSEKLKREKFIQSVYLVDGSNSICNENTIEYYWECYKDKKQKEWLNSIKSYYRVELNSDDFNEYINHPIKSNEKVEDIDKKINIQTWDSIKGLFFEWFIALIFLDGFYDKGNGGEIDLRRGKSVPLNINGDILFFRTQENVKNYFNLQVVPDFIITYNNSTKFDYHNIMGLIECKYLSGNIPAKDIRDIFTKGWQLLPRNICLISRGQLDRNNKEKIKKFGIDVIDNLNYEQYQSNQFLAEYNKILFYSAFKDKLYVYLKGKYQRIN